MALAIPLEDRGEFVRQARASSPEPEDGPTPVPALDEIGQEDLSGRAIRGYALAERLGSALPDMVQAPLISIKKPEILEKDLHPFLVYYGFYFLKAYLKTITHN
jgi:hypothetical protein